MPTAKEIPELVTDLFQMSKEYLLQETVEPAKKLGKLGAMGVAGAFLFAVASVFLVLALFALLRMVLPETEWYGVLARGLTALAAAIGAGAIAWRLKD